jgi:hypothetical protein
LNILGETLPFSTIYSFKEAVKQAKNDVRNLLKQPDLGSTWKRVAEKEERKLVNILKGDMGAKRYNAEFGLDTN